MEKEKFDALMDKFYVETFTMTYMNEKYVFQKRFTAATGMTMGDFPQNKQGQYLVSVLSKDPQFSMIQAAQLPNDFITKVVLKVNKESELSGEDKAAIQKAASLRTTST